MRAIRSLGLVLVVCAALAGCGPGESAAVPCNSDEECGAGEVCTDGVCQAGEPFSRTDAGKPPREGDAGAPPVDGGQVPDDAGDAGTTPLADGGHPAEDGGPDGGGSLDDGGAPDGGVLDGGAPDAGPLDAGLVDGCVRAPAGLGTDLVACALPLSHAEAQAACESMGLTLVEIDSAEDNEVVATFTTALQASVWIGLSDDDDEGVFEWLSGAAVSYDEFEPGEPNDSPPGEDCVQMYQGGGWNDTLCDDPKPYVCGAPNPPLALDEPYCLARPELCACDVVMHGTTMYALCTDERGFPSVVEGCEALGMSPVKVASQQELSFLGQQALLRERVLWTGYGDPDGDGEHAYGDGSASVVDLYPPSSGAGAGTCALVDGDGSVVATPCTEAHGYACELDAPLTIAGDCAPFAGDYLACDTPRTAHEARAVCQRAGMDLVIVDDESENELIATRLSAAGGQWLGYSDARKELLFETVAGGVMAFSDFPPDEPNDYGEGEECLELSAGTGRWNDEYCESLRAFVCEPVLAIPPLPPTGPLCATQPGGCPCEKRVKDGIVYALCAVEAPFLEARAACDALGMRMLDPPSADHDAFVRQHLNALPFMSGVWLGLNDRASEGTFVRQSGEVPAFTSWAPGQPNDDNGQDCVEYNQDLENRWNDTGCTLQRFVACQATMPAESGCADEDGDGHGEGCALGPDCDDLDARRNASALDICNLVDDDCSLVADDDLDGCRCSYSAGDDGAHWLCENAVNWFAARGQCRAYGGKLAVPDNDAENAVIGDVLDAYGFTRAWIGVSDFWTEGDYESVTREPLALTDWAPGQPSNADNEDCVERRADGWYDSSCTTTRPSICELP